MRSVESNIHNMAVERSLHDVPLRAGTDGGVFFLMPLISLWALLLSGRSWVVARIQYLVVSGPFLDARLILELYSTPISSDCL